MRDLDTIRETEAAAAATYARRVARAASAIPATLGDRAELAARILAAADRAPRVPVNGRDETAAARNFAARVAAGARILAELGADGARAAELAAATLAAADAPGDGAPGDVAARIVSDLAAVARELAPTAAELAARAPADAPATLGAVATFYVGADNRTGARIGYRTVAATLGAHGWQGFNVAEGYGAWQGTREDATTIVVAIPAADVGRDLAARVAACACDLARAHRQESVGWTLAPAVVGFADPRDARKAGA